MQFPMIAKYRPMFAGEAPVIAAGGFTPDSAQDAVATGLCDVVAFGRLFLSTPDLPSRIAKRHPPNRYDRQTFYTVWSRPCGTEGKSEAVVVCSMHKVVCIFMCL